MLLFLAKSGKFRCSLNSIKRCMSYIVVVSFLLLFVRLSIVQYDNYSSSVLLNFVMLYVVVWPKFNYLENQYNFLSNYFTMKFKIFHFCSLLNLFKKFFKKVCFWNENSESSFENFLSDI